MAAPAPGLPPTSISQRGLKPVSFREEKTILPVRSNDVLSGRYKLEDKVGEGGMGTVFVAHDSELDRKVAVKLLAANLMNDEEVLERFEREARLTAKLDHPNIVPIYDVGRHEGRPFIVMKLLQGDSLAGRLRAKGGFTADETLKLMKQLAAGLDFIHQQGFIHRDIKAGNIFVSPEGHATILDFGILRQKSATTGITRTGMVMGTPHYMAPEQALGLKDVDHRVDIYALAVVLFECLTGTLPFEADSELRLIQMQAHSPPPEILDRAPWIPRPVADVVKRALAKKPDARFNTGAELVGALDAAYAQAKATQPQAGAAVAPPGPAPAVSPNTAPSQRRLQSRSALRAVSVDQVPPAPEEPSTKELAQAVQTSRRSLWVAAAALAVIGGGGGAALWGFSHQGVGDPPLKGGTTVVAAAVDAGGDEAPDAAGTVAAGTEPDAGAALVAELQVDAGAAEEPGEADAGAELVIKKGVSGKKRGRVNVITTHGGEPYWAQVSIDGVPKGRTPLLLDLPVGSHKVRVERSGFRTQLREIRVAAGRPLVVKLELVP